MIDFNLIRKKPTSVELRAYLYQIICSNFGLADVVVNNMRNQFPSLGDNPYEWDLNQLSVSNIESTLEQKPSKEDYNRLVDSIGIENIDYQPDLYPEEIFFFKTDYEKVDLTFNDYKVIPEIFTGVENASFDKGGLIVMEFFESQILKLFNSKGKELTGYCHDINLGTDGLVLFRDSDDNSGIWHLLQYDGNRLNFDCGEIFGPFDSPSDFPSIRERDLIPEMFPLGEFPIPENYPPENLTREDVIKELEKNEYNYRYLSDYYCDNKELAINAVDSNIFAFTLLSDRLQSNKEFVVKLITRNEKNQWLYSYLNNNFKKDIEIIKLCVSEYPRIIENIEKPVTDKEILLLAIGKDDWALKYADTSLLNDKDFMLNAIRVNGSAIRFASEELRNDKSLAIEAVKKDGFALEYVSDELKDNKDVVIEAVKERKYAIEKASPNLQNNKEFLEYIEKQGFEYNDGSDLPF